MIKGVGVDLVEIQRFQDREDLDDFLTQILTEKEFSEVRDNPKKPIMGSKVFAVKEAILKAFGCGLHLGSYWHDIELSKEFVPTLRGFIGRLADEKFITKIHISHSCSKRFSVALVILEE